MDRPSISVIIPAWNAAATLPGTLDSVLAQGWRDFEVIVVDDGSTDEIEAACAPYADRIRLIRQPNWGGPSRPRNVAIDAAEGDLVAFFDSDDLMEPDKLAAAAEAFLAHPEIDFLFSNFRVIDESDRLLDGDFLGSYTGFREHLQPTGRPDLCLLPGRTAYSLLLLSNFIGTSSVVCRRGLFDQVGGFDEEMLNGDDIDMWRRIAWSGATFAYLDQVLHSYRKVAGGITGRGAARRLPAVLRGLRKQLDLELTNEERRHLQRRIHDIDLDYAYGLCEAKRFGESIEVYRDALGRRVTPAACKGLVRTLVRRFLG